MTAEPRCSFCEGLPLPPSRQTGAGVPGRCPLCKGDILVDHVSRVTYRLDGPAASRGRPPRRAAVWVGLVVFLASGGLLMKFGLAREHLPSRPESDALARVQPKRFVPPPVEPAVKPPQEDRPARTEQPVKAEPVKVIATVPPPLPVEVLPLPTAVSSQPSEESTSRAATRKAPSPWGRFHTSEELAEMLRRVPEVALPEVAAAKKGDGIVGPSPPDLKKMVEEDREQFLTKLLAQRPDLAGLPFRSAKDCQLDRKAAEELERSSRDVRLALSRAVSQASRSRTTDPAAPRAADPESPELPDVADSLIGYHLANYTGAARAKAVPALEQILTGEPAPFRMGLVRHVRYPSESVAAATLARRVLFDTDAYVRGEALRRLGELGPEDYVAPLLNGLRHAWPPVNFHAAEALTALRATQAVPELVKLLDAADPLAPFELEKDGQMVPAVRELVRVNHNRNCLLCHPPSFTPGDPVRAPVPNPAVALAPRFSEAYHRDRASSSGLFVRADVTLLRQDFSEVQTVESPGKWPKQQRFDFLVRVRPLTKDETAAWRRQEQLPGPRPLPASRQAVLYALHELTGRDGGYTTASWEKALAERP